MNIKNPIFIYFAISFSFLMNGCASITQGTSQTIAFNLDPSDTKCDLSRDGEGQIGSISSKNNTLSTGKDKDDIIVKCSAPGHKQKIVRVKSSTQAA